MQIFKHRRTILLLCGALFSLHLFSQDSLAAVVHKKNTYKPAFDFDQRFSFIKNREVNIWGARAGILVNEKFKVGIGTYFSKGKLESYSVDTGTYNGKRNLYFGTVYFEPFIFRFKFVEFSVPFELGAGKSVFRVYNNESGEQVGRIANYFIPTGAGLSLSFKLPPIGRFKPTRWFGINFLAGYRYCAFQGQLENIFPHRFETDYNGLFWSVSGAIFLDRFSDDYKEWHRKRELKKLSR
ncbi:MAG TPA: hypothetical protein VFJ43_14155 [Bacteroidia bacterium]|nr:hypothetical protein [Bacteroidia bacterium]